MNRTDQARPAPARWRARATAVIAGALSLTGVGAVLSPAAANAYTLEGIEWNASSLRINDSGVSGNYASGLQAAVNDYSATQAPSLSLTTASGPTFTARVANYGNTGWEGQTTSVSVLGYVTSANSKLNSYYLSGAGWIRDSVVWAHELGHALGLGHVAGLHHVMYKSASAAFDDGVTGLTADEVNGINYIY